MLKYTDSGGYAETPIWQFRYVTALEVAHLLFSPKSLTYVRERLRRLAGNADHVERQYLYRFGLPTTRGNSQRIFTLGSRGRDILGGLGFPVDWYFRPSKAYLSISRTSFRFFCTKSSWASNHDIVPIFS